MLNFLSAMDHPESMPQNTLQTTFNPSAQTPQPPCDHLESLAQADMPFTTPPPISRRDHMAPLATPLSPPPPLAQISPPPDNLDLILKKDHRIEYYHMSGSFSQLKLLLSQYPKDCPVIWFFSDIDQTAIEHQHTLSKGISRRERQKARQSFLSNTLSKMQDQFFDEKFAAQYRLLEMDLDDASITQLKALIKKYIFEALQETDRLKFEIEERERAGIHLAPNVAQTLKDINAKENINIFALTEYHIPNISKRHMQLRDHGIVFENFDLDQSAFSRECVSIQVAIWQKDEGFSDEIKLILENIILEHHKDMIPCFYNGILCSTKLIGKGPTFEAFLNLNRAHQPSIVLSIDDKPKNLEEEAMCIPPTTKFIGIFYSNYLDHTMRSRGIKELGGSVVREEDTDVDFKKLLRIEMGLRNYKLGVSTIDGYHYEHLNVLIVLQNLIHILSRPLLACLVPESQRALMAGPSPATQHALMSCPSPETQHTALQSSPATLSDSPTLLMASHTIDPSTFFLLYEKLLESHYQWWTLYYLEAMRTIRPETFVLEY